MDSLMRLLASLRSLLAKLLLLALFLALVPVGLAFALFVLLLVLAERLVDVVVRPRRRQAPARQGDAEEDEGCEPWNNGYQLASDMQALLVRLRERSLDEEGVLRHFLAEDEVLSLLDQGTRERVWEDVTRGAAETVASGAHSPAFGEAVVRTADAAEAARWSIAWEDVPPVLRHRCWRRAECVVDYGITNGWLARDEGDSVLHVTEAGIEILDRGGFDLR
jgi:hypothetical protein